MDAGSDRDDATLLRAAADHDLAAIRELYDRHAPWLSARLMRRCNSREVVADVVQDTFLILCRDAHRWRGEAAVAGWLWGIAFRRLASRLRSRKVPMLMPDWESATTGVVPAAEEQVLLGVEHGDLGGALSRLSPELRAVVQATVLDGLTTREAGHLLGVPAGTVKTRMMRAKAALREELA